MAQSQKLQQHDKHTDGWQRGLLWCFHVLLLATPLAFTWANEELFEFNKMILVYLVTLIVIGLWVGRMIWAQQLILRRSLFGIPITLFVASQVISTALSIEPHTSLFGYYTRFNGGLFSTLAYTALFYAFISNLNREHIRPLFRTLFASAVLIIVQAIPEHFGHSFTCLLVNMHQHQKDGIGALLNLGQYYNASCWVQDVQSRVFGTFGQPNWLAAYAITILPLSLVLAVPEKLQKINKSTVAYSVIAIGLFISVLFTKSRSGVLGMAVGLAMILFFLLLRKNQRQLNLKIAGGVSAIFMLCAAIFGTPFTPQIFNSKTVAAPTTEAVANRLDVGGTDSGEIRKIVWTGAIKVWQRYPLFGSGVETFGYSYYLDRPMAHNLVSEWDFLYNKAHNEFLNFLATTGVVGLGTYLLMLGYFVLAPLRKKYLTQLMSGGEDSTALIGLAISSGLIALSISNFFGFSTVMVSLLLMLLPASWLVLLQTPKQIDTSNISERFTTSQGVAFVLTGLFTLLFLYYVGVMWVADTYYARGKQYSQSGYLAEAIPILDTATLLEPQEAYFYDELSLAYARAALSLATDHDASSAAELSIEALRTSDEMIRLNPVHLNLYKTQVRVLLLLSSFQPDMRYRAIDVLKTAIKLAPTDPKLVYNLALVQLDLEMREEGLKNLEQTIVMKPNYEAARMTLGEEYERDQRWTDAAVQYHYVLDHIQAANTNAQARLASISAKLK